MTIRPIVTARPEWLQRHRDTHSRAKDFGTHLHPYLVKTIEGLAIEARREGQLPSLLDYGCGKGAMLAQLKRRGLFRFLRGYDPAVEAFEARPTQRYDIVLCLDVLDQTENDFVTALIEDVAQFTLQFALFDVISKQVATLSHLPVRSFAEWQDLISRCMEIRAAWPRPATEEELLAGACPERSIIVAEQRRA